MEQTDLGVAEGEAPAPVLYLASVFHEIPTGDGVKRVEAGFIVETDAAGSHAYPVEAYLAEYPDADISAIAEWPASSQE